jgi:hypothetical protein
MIFIIITFNRNYFIFLNHNFFSRHDLIAIILIIKCIIVSGFAETIHKIVIIKLIKKRKRFPKHIL